MADEGKPVDLNLTDNKTIHALNNYGNVLSNNGDFDTALTSFRRALQMDPSQFGVWSNLGNLLWKMDRTEEAEAAIRRSIDLCPAFGDNWINLAVLLHNLMRFDEAEEAYAKALELYEDNEEKQQHIIWNRAVMRLGLGEWETGLVDYDIRTRRTEEKSRVMSMPYPTWDGEDLNGKSIYVQTEQGIGDRLLWSRYLWALKQRYPKLKRFYVCASEVMANLFWEFSDFITILPRLSLWPEKVDYAVFHASLIRHLSPTVADIPPDPGLIRRRIDKQRALDGFRLPTGLNEKLVRVGIAWTGSKTMERNLERTIPFPMMLGLAENPKVALFSFQVGNKDIASANAGQLIHDFGPELEQLGLVAAGEAMTHMDLVITACTSTSHLAGVLGVPCWTLLCHSPYWVWLQGREPKETTPWYPNHRLFRQPRSGDWGSVISSVKAELRSFCDRRL